MSDLPEPWTTWATRAGVRPSMTGIGEKAGVPASTISRLLKGRTTPTTVKAVAEALRVGEREVLAAATGESLGPWEPPLSAHLLDAQEREALTLLIQHLTVDRGGSGDAGNAEAQKTPEGTNVPSSTPTTHDASNVAKLTPKHRRLVEESMMVDEAAYSDPDWKNIKDVRETEKRAGEESQDDGGFEPA